MFAEWRRFRFPSGIGPLPIQAVIVDCHLSQAYAETNALCDTHRVGILKKSEKRGDRLEWSPGHGIMQDQIAEKLRKCAKIALQDFDGDLRPVLKLPLSKAKKALQKFPGIGEPGAEKILLFTRTYPVLALESNGLRVLLRLGFGEEKKSYSTTYRHVRQAVKEKHGEDCARLTQAHLLLRRHGQELCRRSEPACDHCPLARDCEYFQHSKSKKPKR